MSGSIGGVDPSVILQAGRGVAPLPNPLQTIGQFAAVKNALNQNALFPGALQQQGIATQGQQLALQKAQNAAAYQVGLPVVANPNFTLDDLTGAWGSAEKNMGIATHQQVSDIASLPQAPNTPEWRQAVKNIMVSRSQTDPGNAVGTITQGAGPQLGNGLNLQPTLAAPASSLTPGALSPNGPAIPQYPSRASVLQQVTWEDGNGVKHYGTQADWAKARGQDGLIGPATPAAGGAPSGPPTPGGVPQPSLGTGHYSAPSSVPDTTGPMPGTPENLIASSVSAHAANQRAATFASDIYPLQQAQTALATAPTGKGTQALHDASSYINTFAPSVIQKGLSFISPVMTPDQIASYDEAKKYLTQGTLGAPGATRSNEGLQTAGAANPSTEISPQAAQLVLKGMIGLRRMEQDATIAFNKSGQPPGNYDKFQTDFATHADPRAYMFDQMTPAERQQTLTSFKDSTKRQAFISQVQRAEANGVLSAPGAPNGQ